MHTFNTDVNTATASQVHTRRHCYVKKNVVMSLWRINDVVITSCVRREVAPKHSHLSELGLSIIWTNAGILSIGLVTNCDDHKLIRNSSDILIEIQTIPSKEEHLKKSSAKWHPLSRRPQCAKGESNDASLSTPSDPKVYAEIPECIVHTGISKIFSHFVRIQHSNWVLTHRGRH